MYILHFTFYILHFTFLYSIRYRVNEFYILFINLEN